MLTTLAILISLLFADFGAQQTLTDAWFRQDTETIVADCELVELCKQAAPLWSAANGLPRLRETAVRQRGSARWLTLSKKLEIKLENKEIDTMLHQ